MCVFVHQACGVEMRPIQLSGNRGMLNDEDHLQQAPYLQQFTRVSIWPMVYDTISISCGNIIYGTVINRG